MVIIDDHKQLNINAAKGTEINTANQLNLSHKEAAQKKIRITSSKIRFMNLKESIRVREISATGTPKRAKGSRNHRKPDASCSGGVVDKQRLALCKICHKNRHFLRGRKNILCR